MFEGILMLSVLLGGGGSADLVSIIGAEDYFASRSIDAKGAKLIELASAAPKDAKGEIIQLLAIRTLGANKDQAARGALEKLAAGPKGFAREYARAALAALDGKPAPATERPRDSLRKEALGWFPADVDFFGAADLRGTPPKGHSGASDLAAVMQSIIPASERENLYKIAEAVGNIRVDRVAFAVKVRENGATMHFRISGEADAKRLRDFLVTVGMTVGECKEPDVILLEPPAGRRGMPIAIVGNGDVVLAGAEGRGDGSIRETIDAALDVRAGRKPAVVKGAFAKDLAGLGDDVASALMGVPWPKMRDGMAASPVGAAPQNFLLTLSSAEAGMTARFRAEAESAEAAAKFVAGFEEIRRQGLAEMERAPRDAPPEIVKSFKAMLEGIKFKSDKAVITGELALPADFAKSLLSMTLMKSGASAPAPRPVPARPVERAPGM